jgi:hypothetical protein
MLMWSVAQVLNLAKLSQPGQPEGIIGVEARGALQGCEGAFGNPLREGIEWSHGDLNPKFNHAMVA